MESVELMEADITGAALEKPLDKHKRDIWHAMWICIRKMPATYPIVAFDRARI